MAATVRYSATRAYGLFAPYTSIAASRPAICPGSSDRNVLVMPLHQILTCDGRHRSILGNSRIRIVCAIHQYRRLPPRDLPRIVRSERTCHATPPDPDV